MNTTNKERKGDRFWSGFEGKFNRLAVTHCLLGNLGGGKGQKLRRERKDMNTRFTRWIRGTKRRGDGHLKSVVVERKVNVLTVTDCLSVDLGKGEDQKLRRWAQNNQLTDYSTKASILSCFIRNINRSCCDWTLPINLGADKGEELKKGRWNEKMMPSFEEVAKNWGNERAWVDWCYLTKFEYGRRRIDGTVTMCELS